MHVIKDLDQLKTKYKKPQALAKSRMFSMHFVVVVGRIKSVKARWIFFYIAVNLHALLKGAKLCVKTSKIFWPEK